MKLRELLEVVPKDYEIGLANFDKNICTISYFKKEDATYGSITAIYKRNSFEDLWEAIGELYYTCVAFHIPTKCLFIDITDTLVKITLSYKGLKVLLPVYPEEEEGE